ncbi:MAG: GDSL-type esterase/lipase family protein [Bacteroidales bacterium]|jgi:lysophospholipase L1-like esterase
MKLNILNYRKIRILFISGVMVAVLGTNDLFATVINTAPYDTTRIYHAMAKARRGEPVTIGVIGGSITEGYGAGGEENEWGTRITEWWQTNFPSSTVSLVNAGFGGTGSDIGVHRMQRDLLQYNPDFIVVEFSVNDTEGVDEPTTMMEGIVQQAYMHDSMPGIMFLLLKIKDGSTAQAAHDTVGDHYGVPMISFVDMIDSAILNDGYTLDDIYLDDVHPNALGHEYMTEFITGELEVILANLPDDEDLPAIWPGPATSIVGEVFSNCYMYTPSDLTYLANNNWVIKSTSWEGNNPGDEISFVVDGNAISILFQKDDDDDWGQVEAWVDDGTHITIDAYWTETWGPATKLQMIADGLADGEHTLHVRVKEENSGGGEGHFFRIKNVLKAGNFDGIAPIANAGGNVKTLVEDAVTLDGSESFDPMDLELVSYEWSVISKPAGSESTIASPGDVSTEITPDVAGYYLIGLVVNNGSYNSVAGKKIIHAVADNTPPAADAGADMTIGTMKFYYLDGSASSDADGDELLYSWRVISESVEDGLVINEPEMLQCQFYAASEGEFTVGLTVNDSIDDSEESIITITAIEGYTAVEPATLQNDAFKIFPNPADNELTVSYMIDKAASLSWSIYDLNGKLLGILEETVKTAGTHEQKFMIDQLGLETGVYIIRFECNDNISTRKFTKY